ncbi:MAG: ABC transporter permease [Lachnospiraceae bacterium]|nr:ABC transporter permease [Lachnospiraceae bacterium]
MNREWLKTEFKRAAAFLPGIIGRAALLLFVCAAAAGGIALCAKCLSDDAAERVRIGCVAPNDALTDMLVSYVQDMESVKRFCSIERVEEEDAFRLLREGGLDMLLVLPEDIVEEIISGSNAPVTVYTTADSAPGGVGQLVFRELADAAVGMLQAAQAEIYAAEYLMGVSASDEELLSGVYNDINRFNLNLVSVRESLFKEKSVSATENDTYVTYYGSALLTLYLLAAGVFLGGFFCHRQQWRAVLEKRLGVSWRIQVPCGFLAGLWLVAAMELLPLLLIFAVSRLNVCGQSFWLCADWRVLAPALLAAAVGTLYFMLIYGLFGEKRKAHAAIGVLALIQGWLSGCFVPSALLPDLVYSVGKYLPASYIKQAFTFMLSGDERRLRTAAAGLFAWGLLLLLLNWAAAFWRSAGWGEKGFHGQEAAFMPGRVRLPSRAGVVLRRMLFKKGILATLVLMAAASLLIVRLERQSDTAFTAAVFDESGEYGELLLAHEGLVSFCPCKSEEEAKELVLRGEAECAYVLPGDLPENVAAMRASRSVTVYKPVDSVCVPLVNEVVFGIVFCKASSDWYTDYMSRLCGDAKLVQGTLTGQLASGRTFGLEFVTLGEGSAAVEAAEEKQTYPVEAVVIAAVILCGAQGLLTALADCRKGSFRKKGRAAVLLLTVLLPMLAAAAAGAALLWNTYNSH